MKLVKKTRHNETRSPGLQALRLHIWSLQHSRDSYLFPGAASGVGMGAWSPWQLPYLTAPGVRCAISWKGCPPRQRGGERRRGGENRREVIRHHLAQRSRLRRLKSGVSIGKALVKSDDAQRRLPTGACSRLVSMGTREAQGSEETQIATPNRKGLGRSWPLASEAV